MLDQMKKHLEAKGVDPSVLDDYESSVAEVVEVEADALTDALTALTKAMSPREEEMKEDKVAEREESLFDLDDQEPMDEESMDEEDMDVEKAYYRDAMKALADNTDKMIADMNKRLDAVMKGVEAMMESMKGMQAESEGMNKSLNALRKEPQAPRAVTSATAQAPAPTGPSRQDFIKKGLSMLQDSDVDTLRKGAVRSAIAQLEAGIPVSAISHIIDLD
jgi:small-conductance mechanosensitive channel